MKCSAKGVLIFWEEQHLLVSLVGKGAVGLVIYRV